MVSLFEKIQKFDYVIYEWSPKAYTWRRGDELCNLIYFMAFGRSQSRIFKDVHSAAFLLQIPWCLNLHVDVLEKTGLYQLFFLLCLELLLFNQIRYPYQTTYHCNELTGSASAICPYDGIVRLIDLLKKQPFVLLELSFYLNKCPHHLELKLS